MASKFRNVLASNTLSTLRSLKVGDGTESARSLAAHCKLAINDSRISFNLDSRIIPRFSSHLFSNFVKTFPDVDGVNGVAFGEDKLKFFVDTDEFIQQVLKTTAARPKNYKWSRNALFEKEEKHVMVEFSSPNIAKPFHIGHFRSAIIGNFVANINKAVGHRVTKINYLGDWGTQFGYLIAGIEHFNVDIKQLKEGSLRKLLDVYVKANKLGEENDAFNKKAREIFSRLENGDEDLLNIWKYFKEISITELKDIYARLNIEFDEYHGESMYARDKSKDILDLLDKTGLLEEVDGCRAVRLDDNRPVVIVKSDGSSLYITRDIAALINRFEVYSLDHLVYVVDNSQSDHFKSLFSIVCRLGFPAAAQKSAHIGFGKIRGMSTRKGSVVFLDTIIDEAKARMLEKQVQTKTTRVFGEEGVNVANELAISALVVADCKHKRRKDYKFSWENALSHNGDTGVRLQYLHARLNSLVERCGVELDLDCSTLPLTETEALELAFQIGCWDEVLSSSYRELEPAILVSYLFRLANFTNKAFKVLAVKGQPDDVARARLLLFYCSKQILAEAFAILAIKPIDRM